MRTVYGRRVRQARRIRRFSVSFVADKVGIRQPRLSEIERSYASDISEETAANLSSILDFPVRFFSVEPHESLHLGSLLFRAKATLTDTDAEHLAEYANAAGEIFEGLSRNASSPSVRLPELRNEVIIAEAASIVRQQFSIKPETPIDNLVRKAERAGVIIINIAYDSRLHDRLDAFSCWVGNYADRPVIVVRSSASWDRQRWSIAHELGHAVLHRRQRDGDIEVQANSFANELLLPQSVLREDWPRVPTLMSLLPLKERWGISIQALIEHGFRADLLDDARRMSLYKQLSNRKWPDGTRWREREPGYNARDAEQPRMLGKMVEVGFGFNASLDSITEATGHWPVLLLQQLIGAQLRSPRAGRRAASSHGTSSKSAHVINLSDFRKSDVPTMVDEA